MFTFNGATFGAGPVNTSFVIGTSNFKVQPGEAIDHALADVTLGFYNAGVDGLFDNAGSPVAPVFLDGYVIPVTPSITALRSVLNARRYTAIDSAERDGHRQWTDRPDR